MPGRTLVISQPMLMPWSGMFEQVKLAEQFVRPNGQPDYAVTMAWVTLSVFLILILLAALGREARGIEF